MKRYLKHGLLTFAMATLTACGFHFQTGELLPENLKVMSLDSDNPNGDMTRIMKRELRLNNVKVVPAQKNIPIFRLLGEEQNTDVAALFYTGKAAEKVLILEVEANVILPNKKTFLLSTRVERNFFDSPQEALAKATEKDSMWSSMRKQAATQLINRLISLQNVIEKEENNQKLLKVNK